MKTKKTSTQNQSQKSARIFSKFFCFLFAFAVLGGGLVLLNPQEASAATYYVDSSVTDTNPASTIPDFTTYNSTTFATTGGSDSVFKTIADINAFSALQPGDNVYFRKGQTWREQLTVPASGMEGSVITFGAYGSGDKPIISGADNITGWEENGTNVWNASLTIQPHQVFFNGTRGTEVAYDDVNATNKWNWSSNILRVYSTSDPDTAYTEPGIEAMKREQCIAGTGQDYITIDGVTATMSKISGILNTGGGTNWVIQNNTIEKTGVNGGQDAAIKLLANGDSPLIDSNTISNIYGDAIWIYQCDDVVISNNDIDDVFGDHSDGTHVEEATGFTISENNFDNDGGGTDFSHNAIIVETSSGIGTITKNYAEDFGAGLQLAGGTAITTVSYNYIKNMDIVAGYWMTSGVDNITFIGNIIDTCVRFIGTDNSEHIGIKMYNNIFYHEGIFTYGTIFYQIDGEFKNNILWLYDSSSRHYRIASISSGGSFVSDYNILGQEKTGFVSYNGNVYDSLISYNSGESQDNNSLTSNPLFTNSSGFMNTSTDFQLLWNSSAIDAGTDINLTTDYAGNPIYGTPDIGAYEYQPPYTISTDEIDTTGNIRIYTDGKFRNTTTAGGTTADLSITPSGGFGAGDYSEWMNIDIETWNTTGTYSKKWTETTSNSSLNSAHTVGDLSADIYYTVWYTKSGGDKTRLTTEQADGSSQITFTYDQGYSSVEFEIEEDTTSPAAFTLLLPANNYSTSNNQPTFY